MTSAYEELVGVLYDNENRKALEWAIGSILNNGPKKTVVIYGPARTGKTTMLRIVEELFPGEVIKVDVDDTPTLDINGHMFMEVNKPIDIEDAKTAGDVILVRPTGRLHHSLRYYQLLSSMFEETDTIAHICSLRYREMGPKFYDLDIPKTIPEG